MKGQPTTSTVRIGTRDGSDTAAHGLAGPPGAAFDASAQPEPVGKKPRAALRSAGMWTHTLVLTGELTRRSAHALETEIEDLCEKGVTGITLDLRQLTYIDSVGVSVIAFRCGLCQRQGYAFSLIPGARFIQRAFEQAGIVEELPFKPDEIASRRRSAWVGSQRSCEGA